MNTRCPVCRGTRLKPWGVRNDFSLLECAECSHIFADIRQANFESLVSEQIRAFFPGQEANVEEAYYRHLCKAEAEGKHTWRTTRIILREAARYFGTRRGNWLDIGAGSGFLVKSAGERGWDALGIEPGGWGQIAARERNIRVVRDYLKPDTFRERFTVISMTDVLEHQPDPHELLKLTHDYLQPDGLAFLSVPYANSVQGKLQRANWEMVMPPNHCQFFTKRSFCKLLQQTGFQLKRKMQYNASPLPCLARPVRLGRMADWLVNRLGIGDQVVFVIKSNGGKN